MSLRTRLAAFAAALVLTASAALAEAPPIRVAVLKFGTVNWLMETIRAEGLDAANGFTLETLPLAGGPATAIAFQSGTVNMMVTDWVWAMKKQADGTPIRWTPYSSALGALMTRGDLAGLCDLRGRPVGVVGGAIDKSWLIFQALTRRRCGFDLAAEVEALYGAPPLMSRQLTDGAVDAVSTYWHFVARLEAEGAMPLITVDEALASLGLTAPPPLVGFVWKEGALPPGLITAFQRAVRDAGAILLERDSAWERLRPLMRAGDEGAFTALRAAYRAGIPRPWTAADTKAARRLHAILLEEGGAAFAATAGTFDPAVFAPAAD